MRSVRWAAHWSGGFKSLRRSDEERRIQEAGVMPRWPEREEGMEKPKRARRRKLDTAKVDLEPPPAVLRRAGCSSRGGIRRACGEVPGRSRGSHPMTNRSAKGGTGSSLRYGGEGVLIHPPHQGVCGRHGTEDQCVTPGGLAGSPSGIGVSDPISVKAKWEAMPCESSDGRIVP